MTFELGLEGEGSPVSYLQENVPDGENNWCKDPKSGVCLTCPKTPMCKRGVRGTVVDEVGDARGGGFRSHGTLQFILKTLAFNQSDIWRTCRSLSK